MSLTFFEWSPLIFRSEDSTRALEDVLCWTQVTFMSQSMANDTMLLKYSSISNQFQDSTRCPLAATGLLQWLHYHVGWINRNGQSESHKLSEVFCTISFFLSIAGKTLSLKSCSFTGARRHSSYGQSLKTSASLFSNLSSAAVNREEKVSHWVVLKVFRRVWKNKPRGAQWGPWERGVVSMLRSCGAHPCAPVWRLDLAWLTLCLDLSKTILDCMDDMRCGDSLIPVYRSTLCSRSTPPIGWSNYGWVEIWIPLLRGRFICKLGTSDSFWFAPPH